jgi:DNA-directed RNA polymerase subunit RPC12/RpoP
MRTSFKCQHCGAPFDATDLQSRAVECAYCGVTTVLEPEARAIVVEDTRAFASKLYKAIGANFDVEELQNLVVRLGEVLPAPYTLDYGNLGGDNKLSKSRELVLWCRRRGLLQTLVDGVLEVRPSLEL